MKKTLYGLLLASTAASHANASRNANLTEAQLGQSIVLRS